MSDGIVDAPVAIAALAFRYCEKSNEVYKKIDRISKKMYIEYGTKILLLKELADMLDITLPYEPIWKDKYDGYYYKLKT